jgi:hypothetical protein
MLKGKTATEQPSQAYQSIFPLHICICKWPPILIDELERAADLRFPNTFRSFGHAFALHACFFVAEVEDESHSRGEEESACFPRERLDTSCVSFGSEHGLPGGEVAYTRAVSRPLFLHGLVFPGRGCAEWPRADLGSWAQA